MKPPRYTTDGKVDQSLEWRRSPENRRETLCPARRQHAVTDQPACLSCYRCARSAQTFGDLFRRGLRPQPDKFAGFSLGPIAHEGKSTARKWRQFDERTTHEKKLARMTALNICYRTLGGSLASPSALGNFMAQFDTQRCSAIIFRSAALSFRGPARAARENGDLHSRR